MSNSYLALLRGINVGGKNIIKMAELKVSLVSAGLTDVRTYIQSGNILFCSTKTDTAQLEKTIRDNIAQNFKIDVGVALFSKDEWQKIVAAAPKQWGKDDSRKHNLLVLLKPYDMEQVIAAIGELKPEIEVVTPGEGVLYQSISWEMFGRATSGKLASNPVYKQMTIRNYNTATKLLSLF